MLATLIALLATMGLMTLVAIFISRTRLELKVNYFWGSRHNSSIFSSEAIGTALLVFWRAWGKHFPGNDKEVFQVLNKLDIEFRDKPWDIPGEGKILGEIKGKRRICIWRGGRLQDGYRISRTALPHQLISLVLLHLKGDPFFGREGKKYDEWIKPFTPMLKEIHDELRNRGF